MRLLDSRRLTGPNLLSNYSGAIIDVELFDNEVAVINGFEKYLRALLNTLDWRDEKIFIRHYTQGASVAISAPADCLYAATECLEWVWQSVVNFHENQIEPDLVNASKHLRQVIIDEKNADVMRIIDWANQSKVMVLRDDDYISLGYGKYSQTWPIDKLPDIRTLNAQSYKNIPVAIVTGTNGKTTSVRLASHIMRAANNVVGISSTDGIAVDNDVLDTGDYSGPGGAREILRDKRVDVAILETARGGLLRRGLAIDKADAVLITNVAEDHMGDFGVKTIEQLADVKWIVSRCVATKQNAAKDNRKLILNADDALIVARANASDFNIAWFSINPNNPLVQAQIKHGGSACTIEDGRIILYGQANGQATRHDLLSIADVPITLNGAAEHNSYNVLGAILLCYQLGASVDEIKSGLVSFSTQDNPGRCNLFEINGAKVLVDFAHNPHGIGALLQMTEKLPATRKLLLIGQAGDRSDDDIRALVDMAVSTSAFDKVIIKSMSKYARGREENEVVDILYKQFIKCGLAADKVDIIACELEAVKSAVDWAQQGDLLILLTHEQRDEVLAFLAALEK